MTALLAPLAGALAGCPSSHAVSCVNGRYCPEHTQCGTDEVCLADPRQCHRFDERTPCVSDVFGRGHCFDDTCVPGVRMLGMAAAAPDATPVANARVAVLDHPEVTVVQSTAEGLFELAGVPRTSPVVIEATTADHWPTVSRILETGVETFFLDGDLLGRAALPLLPPDLVAAIAAQLGIAVDPERGIVAGAVWAADTRLGLSGAVASITGTTCEAIIYLDETGVVSGQSGTIAEADGVFAMLNCGLTPDAEVTVAHPTLSDCSLTPPDGVASIRGHVAASTMTWLGHVMCR